MSEKLVLRNWTLFPPYSYLRQLNALDNRNTEENDPWSASVHCSVELFWNRGKSVFYLNKLSFLLLRNICSPISGLFGEAVSCWWWAVSLLWFKKIKRKGPTWSNSSWVSGKIHIASPVVTHRGLVFCRITCPAVFDKFLNSVLWSFISCSPVSISF